MTVTAAQRQTVHQRAGGCCEYCRLQETDETSPFHIDHIVPIKHRGTDELDNLCLACYQCNAFKGPNMAAADSVTGAATFLFNPRTQSWQDHFRVNPDATLTGITPEGRVTIEVMSINEEARVQYRQEAMGIGEYPC
jgi:hypothetical protein